MGSALTRFRYIAWIVGVVLIVLMFVAMPMKYIGHDPTMVQLVSPVHGFLYMVYIVAAFMLAQQQRWSLGRTVLLLLAGTIPVLSFVAERWATNHVREPVPA
jgi:integral membrane protein